MSLGAWIFLAAVVVALGPLLIWAALVLFGVGIVGFISLWERLERAWRRARRRRWYR